MKKIVAIVGPTGVGKSTLALKIAPRFGAEIVGCDSRQVYRLMDIGTAKPSSADLLKIPHHLIDIINPDRKLGLSDYKELAFQTIDEILDRGKLPLLAGGTGQYFWSVVENWDVPRVPPLIELRKELEAEANADGIEKLYDELQRVDPEAAGKIDPRNVRRVVRALEVIRSTGVPFSRLQNKKPPSYNTLIVGLTMDRKELYRRVDTRVDDMIKQGLVDEVKRLVDAGYGFDLPAMTGIGYRQVGEYLEDKVSFEEAVSRIKFETHRYVRQQYAWFKLKDERIHWFNVAEEFESEIISLINKFLSVDN